MKWNIFLGMVSIAMLVAFVGGGLGEHWIQAESVAEDLSPLIGVDKNIIRSHLESILQKGSVRRTVVLCSPLALLSILLMGRLIVDLVGHNKTHS
jgi:hypothetical protein